MWFIKIMVRFFFTIDSALFNFIATLYDLLIAISRTSVLSQGDIAQFATRIEILLGIFMLFKMSFSLITYIVNPDDFTDKQKGFGKLVQNSVISLVLLVLVPYIFQMAFSLQAKILNDNLLAKLLLGERINDEEGDGNKKVTIIDTAGNEMAFQIMLPFFSPNVALDGVGDCVNLYDATGTKFSDTCKEALRSAGMESTTDEQGSQYGPWLENYVAGVENRSLGLTFRLDAALDTADYNKGEEADDFVIDYKYPLSTAAAVITCLLLITFCIDIGVRSVKLAFLQLIYPIPVISFMDPKSGKDGIFSKWYKMCLSTFLSLFIRLLALYFGVYIITRVGRHGIIDVINGSEITAGWVKLFVIIGILMFVKQSPKILENLGVKIDGDGTFNLNPLKKVMDEKNGVFGAKQIKRAGVAAGAAGLAGAAAFGTNLIARKGNPFSAIAGAVSGARRGLTAGLKGEKLGKAYTSSYGGAMTARTNRADRGEMGINALDVASENLKKKMHIANQAEKNQAQLKHLEDYISAGKAAKSRAESEVDKKLNGINVGNDNLGALKNKVDVLKNLDVEKYRASHKYSTTQEAATALAKEISQAESDYFGARKTAVNSYMEHADKLKKGATFGSVSFGDSFDEADSIVSSNINKMEQLDTVYDMGQTVDRTNLGKSIQSAENKQTEIKTSKGYMQSELISQQAQKEKSSK